MLGGDRGPRRDIVVLNAGAGLMAAGRADNLGDAIEQAGAAIDSGAASRALDLLIETSNLYD